ncbi:inner membrane protein YhaH [Deinococcus carri]|uniref:Inner membrane protein YhaH n=1 Tax=Deinococcus carri TaxID=1211323 RepID=A0ABP9W9E6_9DEIO
MFALINGIISLILQLPYQMQTFSATANGLAPEPTGLGLVSIVLTALYGLALFLPSLAVTIRRLHDTGRSGWWVLISLIPLIGGLVLFIFLVLDSQPGPNKWGPNPKGMQSGAASW